MKWQHIPLMSIQYNKYAILSSLPINFNLLHKAILSEIEFIKTISPEIHKEMFPGSKSQILTTIFKPHRFLPFLPFFDEASLFFS